MSKQERDILEEMFHAKLYDHEVDTAPEDWEMIMNRLPESKPVVHTFRHRWLYVAAAAVAALVMTTSILYITNEQQPAGPTLAKENVPTIEKPVVPAQTTEPIPVPVETPLVAAHVETPAQTGTPVTARTTRTTVAVQHTAATTSTDIVTTDNNTNSNDNSEETFRGVILQEKTSTTLIADAQPVTTKAKTKTRRWGFGMGGGGLTTNATNTFNSLVLPSASYQVDDDMILLNAPLKSVDYQTTLKHRTPVNVGVSGSYYINNRWSIQVGLSYSLLVSETKQNAVYHRQEEQRLHFIGIPISIAYKIAEWNKFQLYGTAGFMPEINVAGKFKTEEWADDILKSSATESLRMRDIYWSVNARAGVSYPVVRFVNAFAEVGAGYYFDNNSNIETIHSEKPFNVSFNFGLRFGF